MGGPALSLSCFSRLPLLPCSPPISIKDVFSLFFPLINGDSSANRMIKSARLCASPRYSITHFYICKWQVISHSFSEFFLRVFCFWVLMGRLKLVGRVGTLILPFASLRDWCLNHHINTTQEVDPPPLKNIAQLLGATSRNKVVWESV